MRNLYLLYGLNSVKSAKDIKEKFSVVLHISVPLIS